MDFLKSSMDPMRYNTLPPNIFNTVTFSKRIDLSANFVVQTPAIPYENVPTSSGVIVWMPCRGLATTYRFGIVSAGTVSTGAAMGAGINIPPPFGTGIKYFSDMPLPYNNVADSNATITFAPTINEQTLSNGRIYAGTLKVVCDTLPVGVTALNGYLSAVSVTDIRDVFQVGGNGNGQGSLSAFNPSQMVQASALYKDGLKEIAIQRGVTAVVGPDIPVNMGAPDRNSIYNQHGSLVGDYQMTGLATPPAFAVGSPVPFNSYTRGLDFFNWVGWFSPYDIYMQPLPPFTPVPFTGTLQQITATTSPSTRTQGNNGNPNGGNSAGALSINPIGGCYEITLSFAIAQASATGVPTPPGTNNPPPGFGETFYAAFSHLYASVSSNGGIYYNGAFEIQTATSDGGAGINKGGWTQMTSCPKKHQTFGFAAYNPQNLSSTVAAGSSSVGGMYIGTTCLVDVKNSGTADWVPTGTQVITTGSIVTGPTNAPFITIRSIDDYAPNELGPVRVIRWDGLVNQGSTAIAGAQVRVSGTYMAECLPGGLSAPFVQASGNLARGCVDVNALTFLAQAYNGDNTPFKRVWVSKDFEDYVNFQLPLFDTTCLRRIATPRLLAAAASCNILKEPCLEDIENGNAARGAKRTRDGVESMVEEAVAKRASVLSNAANKLSTADRLKEMDTIMGPVARMNEMGAIYRPE